MPKNLLVFLHGKGRDKNELSETVAKLASIYNVEVVGIDAPFPYKDGYSWWHRVEQDGIQKIKSEDFNCSVEKIVSEVNAALGCRECGWERVILAGHSQGGMMAVHLGLKMHAQAVISLAGDFPEYFSYGPDIAKTMPIYWIEAGKDRVLNAERRSSYKYLEKLGCQLHYFYSPESEHSEFGSDVEEFIKSQTIARV